MPISREAAVAAAATDDDTATSSSLARLHIARRAGKQQQCKADWTDDDNDGRGSSSGARAKQSKTSVSQWRCWERAVCSFDYTTTPERTPSQILASSSFVINREYFFYSLNNFTSPIVSTISKFLGTISTWTKIISRFVRNFALLNSGCY